MFAKVSARTPCAPNTELAGDASGGTPPYEYAWSFGRDVIMRRTIEASMHTTYQLIVHDR